MLVTRRAAFHHRRLQNAIKDRSNVVAKIIYRRKTSINPSKEPPLPPPTPSHASSKAFGIGTLAGVLGSLAGMGGGFVMIPLMTSSLLRLPQHAAHGTSLCAVAATGVAGALSYSQNNSIDVESAITISTCAMVTARLGAKAITRFSEPMLKKCLGAFMIAIAPIVPAKQYIDSLKKDRNESNQSKAAKIATMGMIGLGSGFMAGLFGVGGGAVVVPSLTLFTDMDHYTALGTSLCAMCLPAMVGSMTHFQKGNVAVRLAPALAVGSFVGSYFGGKVGVGMKEEHLRYGFSGLIFGLGVRTVTKA